MNPQIGANAPQIELIADNGDTVTLSATSGKNVVLYFYPKDDTPGCTAEALEFTALASQFNAQNTLIFGISPDNIAKHCKFKSKYDLNVRLLADEQNKAALAYGVWAEKSMYGKTYMGIERSTFLIDGNGKIVEIWRKVKVPGHAEAVLDAVKAMNA